MKPTSIVFFGLFGQDNIGNDCTLEAMMYHARLRLPGAKFKCICSGPEKVREIHAIPTYDMYASTGEVKRGKRNGLVGFLSKFVSWIGREVRHGVGAVRFLRGSDVMVVPGTGLLVDHTTGFRGYPFYLYKWSLIARLCGCRILIFSVGAGPIYHPLSRMLFRGALSMAAYRSYRDEFSKDYIRDIGFRANGDAVYPDLAFSLPEAMFPRYRDSRPGRTVVGVGLVDYYGPPGTEGATRSGAYRDYVDKIVAFITWLQDNEYGVRLLIGDVQYDVGVLRDVLESLEGCGIRYENRRIEPEPINTLSDLLGQLSQCDIIVSSRFHNIILALMMKKGVISLSYNEKFESLMDAMGLSGYCQRLEELDVEELCDQLIRLQRDVACIRKRIGRKINEYRDALENQYARSMV